MAGMVELISWCVVIAFMLAFPWHKIVPRRVENPEQVDHLD